MNNALVIKNASFLTNKVTTVTFDEPCTGIEFDESSVTFSSLGAATVGYTTTPSSTTDTVTLASSDTSIISVSGTTMTVNGIGTCTLTISCGEFSDTCSVTVDIYESPVYRIGGINVMTSGTTGFEYDGGYGRGNGLGRLTCFGAFSDGYFDYPVNYVNADYGFNPAQVTAIKIPNNTKKIHLYAKRLSSSTSVCRFLDADEQYSYSSGTYLLTPIIDYANLTSSVIQSVRTIDEDVDVPEGCTGFVVTFEVYPSIPDTITTEEALIEWAEEKYEISIHYLPDTEAET